MKFGIKETLRTATMYMDVPADILARKEVTGSKAVQQARTGLLLTSDVRPKDYERLYFNLDHAVSRQKAAKPNGLGVLAAATSAILSAVKPIEGDPCLRVKFPAEPSADNMFDFRAVMPFPRISPSEVEQVTERNVRKVAKSVRLLRQPRQNELSYAGVLDENIEAKVAPVRGIDIYFSYSDSTRLTTNRPAFKPYEPRSLQPQIIEVVSENFDSYPKLFAGLAGAIALSRAAELVVM